MRAWGAPARAGVNPDRATETARLNAMSKAALTAELGTAFDNIIGVVSGTLGSLFAWLASLGVDWALEHVAPKFPFKPDSLFNFEWWIFASAIGLSILFCVLGGLLPALRASRLEPAAALAQN